MSFPNDWHDNTARQLYSVPRQMMNVGHPIICFSHLRWDFIFQRPQHILTRAAKRHDVYFIEDPAEQTQGDSSIRARRTETGVTVITPYLSPSDKNRASHRVAELVGRVIPRELRRDSILWYYNPMALDVSWHWDRALTVYDCIDGVTDAHPPGSILDEYERHLLGRCNLVFVGGPSLYEQKKELHHSVHTFPSSIDPKHFSRGSFPRSEPDDQARLKGFKVGYYGPIDERFDRKLLEKTASLRPDWEFILIGPLVDRDVSVLPQAPNIHYLGDKSYIEAPDYMQFWNVAIIPFLWGKRTRATCPAKVLEYLAAGRGVVSTPIKDIEAAYGNEGPVTLAATPEGFAGAILESFKRSHEKGWSDSVHALLAQSSWDKTWEGMSALLAKALPPPSVSYLRVPEKREEHTVN